MPKKDNMLAILWMLNSGEKLTAKQISEELEVNIRTVYRYIDALCSSGVTIRSDAGHHGGYSLLNHFIRAPLLFDMEEKKILLHAAVFAKEAGYPLTDTLENATSKLKMYSNEQQESTLNQQLSGFEVINRMASPSSQLVLAELEHAVEKEITVEMDYRTNHDEKPKNRMVDPYGIVYWNNKWYTVAFCHRRNEIRSFRVDRILQIKRTQLVFKRPEALDELSMHWFLGHHLQERTSNQAIFLFEEKSIHNSVPYFLLSYGTSIRIIEPQRVKDRLVAIATELMEYYQQ